jgi:hypothetical protein
MIRSFHSKWSTSSILFLSHQKSEKDRGAAPAPPDTKTKCKPPPPPQVGADRAAVCPSASARRDLASRQECASRSNAATSPIFPPHRLFSGAQVVRVALGRPRPARAANLARLGFPTEVGVKIMLPAPGQQAGLPPGHAGPGPADQPGSAERPKPRSRWALLLPLGAPGRRADWWRRPTGAQRHQLARSYLARSAAAPAASPAGTGLRWSGHRTRCLSELGQCECDARHGGCRLPGWQQRTTGCAGSGLGMATGISPSGFVSPYPSPRQKNSPAGIPTNSCGGHFFPIPVPRGDKSPSGIPVPA